MKVLSVKQPWAYLICSGIKPVENRTWKLPEKMKEQRVLIHASAKIADIYFSSIIGSVEIVDCVQNHPSVWAEKGVWNWVLANPVLFERPIENVKGKLSFWEYDLDIKEI